MGDRIKHIKKYMEDFLCWWADELMGILPASVRKIFIPHEKSVEIFFNIKRTIVTLPTETSEIKRTLDLPFPQILETSEFKNILLKEVNHPVTIILSEDLILERPIILPKAAKNNFRNIVKLQLPRLLPMAEQDIHFDCLIIEESEQSDLTISVAMIARHLSEKITAIITATGHRVNAIKGLSSTEKNPLFTFLNLGKKHKALESRMIAGLVVGLLALTILFTTVHYSQLSKREAFLSQKMKELSQDVRGIEALSNEIQNFDQQQELYQSKLAHLRLDEVLSNLTKLMPDDSWIFDFTMAGNRLTISGKTSNASLLVEKIDNSPLFSNVTNSSSRISNSSANAARERFSISFELEGGQND